MPVWALARAVRSASCSSLRASESSSTPVSSWKRAPVDAMSVPLSLICPSSASWSQMSARRCRDSRWSFTSSMRDTSGATAASKRTPLTTDVFCMV